MELTAKRSLSPDIVEGNATLETNVAEEKLSSSLYAREMGFWSSYNSGRVGCNKGGCWCKAASCRCRSSSRPRIIACDFFLGLGSLDLLRRNRVPNEGRLGGGAVLITSVSDTKLLLLADKRVMMDRR